MKSYGIYEVIESDEELLKLYRNDATFKKSIDCGYHEEWSNEKIMLFALKMGYADKEATQSAFTEYMKSDCRPFMVGDKMYGIKKEPFK